MSKKSQGKMFSAEHKKFTWVPAAITYPSDGGIGIYVKHQKNEDRIVVVEQGNGYLWVKCPDRDLVLVSNTHQGWSFRPMEGTFDEYIHLGTYHDHTNKDANLPYFMVNYLAESTKKFQANCRRGVKNRDPNSLIMADSGGYQILQGRVEYLDPNNIIDWYNDNADIGFSLDVPVDLYDPALLKRSAKIQASNNEVMVNKKAEGLELVNIIHGSNIDNLKMFKSIVDHPEIERIAMGGLYYFFDLLGSADAIYQLVNSGREYKHIHILGVANSLHIALLTRMATKGLVPHMTSDSSTAMQKARLREWHSYTATQEKVRYVPVGYSRGYRPSAKALLPCSCQVCSAIKYADVLWCLNGNIAHKVFEFHNIHSMTHYFDILGEYSAEMSTKEYKQILQAQVGENRQGFEEALHALDYLDSLTGVGYEKTRNKFKLFLPEDAENFSKSSSPSGLFSGVEVVEEIVHKVDDDNEDLGATRLDNSEAILKRYEDTNVRATMKHGKKIKTEIANTRSTKNVSGGTRTKPLTASEQKKLRQEGSK